MPAESDTLLISTHPLLACIYRRAGVCYRVVGIPLAYGKRATKCSDGISTIHDWATDATLATKRTESGGPKSMLASS